MGRLILDTTVLVDAERGGDALAEAIDDGDDVAIAAITVAELKVGVEMASGKRRRTRAEFVSAVLASITVEVYDSVVAEAHAELLAHTRRTGRPRGAHDLIIAATGRARGRQVVTLELAGFADLPEVSARTLPAP